MPRRSRDGVADDSLHNLGRSQGQLNYAAFCPTISSSLGYPCSTAPLTAPLCNASAYDLHTWSTLLGINPSYPDWSLFTGNSISTSGGSPHLESSRNNSVLRSRSSSSTSPTYPHHYGSTYGFLNNTSNTPIPHFHYRTYGHATNSVSTTTPITDNYNLRGMQPFLENISPLDSIPAENEESSTTSKKRHRDISKQDDSSTVNQMERPSKILRTNSSPHIPSPERFLLAQGDGAGSDQQRIKHNSLANTATSSDVLEHDQENFIQQWVGFVMSRSQANFSNESLNALATLTQARPQLIFEHIQKMYPSIDDTNQFPFKQQSSPHLFSPTDSSQPYNLAAANSHLPPPTLVLVTKYITSCHRTRPRTDGRRSVNTGPYRCLHGCGYRTKRAFDWRRHEETHEPQELWLCTLCSQQDTQRGDDPDTDGVKKEPFMVSRKDKFLRHARESHKDWIPEKVLELSRLDYKPSEELKCPMCGLRCKTWDDRCRHVLAHFEEEVEHELGRGRGVLDASKGSVEGSVVSPSESVLSEGSDEDGFKE